MVVVGGWGRQEVGMQDEGLQKEDPRGAGVHVIGVEDAVATVFEAVAMGAAAVVIAGKVHVHGILAAVAAAAAAVVAADPLRQQSAHQRPGCNSGCSLAWILVLTRSRVFKPKADQQRPNYCGASERAWTPVDIQHQ